VLAVLDWELSTLGDPLADFATTAWPGTSTRRSSAASRASTGPRSASPRSDSTCDATASAPASRFTGDWNFYLAYNMFRIAAILQGIMKRVVDGTAASAQALDAGAGAQPMAELAWRYAQKVPDMRGLT
jgi:aminoglycoside phosphotransferase (APT) family kinase protein